MEAILRITLSNTLLAAVLALAAMAVSRIFRRPALSHALWLIVLLKLITPPLWSIALPLMPAEKAHKPPLPPVELSLPPVDERKSVQAASSQAEGPGWWAVPTLQEPVEEIAESKTAHALTAAPRLVPS